MPSESDYMADALAAAGLDVGVYAAELAAEPADLIPAPIRANVTVQISGDGYESVWLGPEWIGNLIPWHGGYMARGVTEPVSRDDAIDYLLAAFRVGREVSP